jgi:Lrp/AsnC family transcriptional regulator, regulator for asnA, asnC and gidA
VGALDGIEYVVLTAGSFDILAEVVAVDDEGLLELIRLIRAVPGVRSTESFIYLKLTKQTYSWGAH